MNIENDLNKLVELEIISKTQSEKLLKINNTKGFAEFRVAFSALVDEETKKLKMEESELEKSIVALNKENREVTNRYVKDLEREAKDRAKRRKASYASLQKTVVEQQKIIDRETDAASRKIDEIIAGASAKIEQEILKKIREKIV